MNAGNSNLDLMPHTFKKDFVGQCHLSVEIDPLWRVPTEDRGLAIDGAGRWGLDTEDPE